MKNQIVAEKCIEKMYSNDHCTKKMGIKIVRIEEHRITTTMTVTKEMLNGFATCHGGQLFTLADSTFAFACNMNNQATVAAGCDINYLSPAFEDDQLTAVSKQLSASNRLGLYEITITNQHGKTIAIFHGRSYTLKGKPIL